MFSIETHRLIKKTKNGQGSRRKPFCIARLFWAFLGLSNVKSVCNGRIFTMLTIVIPGGGRGMAADEGLGSGSLAFSFEAPFEVG